MGGIDFNILPESPDDFVSVIVPIYSINARSLLYTKMCLYYLLRNGSYAHEVILVDDGSNQETKDYLAFAKSEFEAKKRKCILITHEKNIGLSTALNNGYEASSGKWIAELCIDVIIPWGWMDFLVYYLKHNEHVGVVSGIDYFHESYLRDNNAWKLIASARGKVEKYWDALCDHPKNWELYFEFCYEDAMLTAYADKVRAYTMNFVSPYVKGDHWMFTRKALASLGRSRPWDEHYNPFWRDDSDLLMSLEREAGYEGVAIGNAFVHHFGRGTLQAIENSDALLKKNTEYFKHKWGFEPKR